MQGETFAVEVVIIGGDEKTITAILTPYVLTIERAAIESVASLAQPVGLRPDKGHAARLILRCREAIVSISDGAAAERAIWVDRSSFARASRANAPVPVVDEPPEIIARTNAFLRAHGVDRDSGDSNRVESARLA